MAGKLLQYEKPFQKTQEDLCMNCGRFSPPCNCGSETNKECSIHSEPMRVIAIPIYATREGQREIAGWIDVAECPRLGCGAVRSLKYGQGVDRNCNRKRGRA